MTVSNDIAVLAAMLTQPFASDAERHAAASKLQRLSMMVRRMEHMLDDIVAEAEYDAQQVEAREVQLRPVTLTLVSS